MDQKLRKWRRNGNGACEFRAADVDPQHRPPRREKDARSVRLLVPRLQPHPGVDLLGDGGDPYHVFVGRVIKHIGPTLLVVRCAPLRERKRGVYHLSPGSVFGFGFGEISHHFLAQKMGWEEAFFGK